jgi:mannose-6-phosphate isomerase
MDSRSPLIVTPALRAAGARAREWLFEAALPLWHARAMDRDRGGWAEALDLSGAPLDLPRRIQIHPRQAYVLALAGRLGWRPAGADWRDAVAHSLAAAASYRRADGLHRFKMSPEGAIVDDVAQVYGQAFVLFGLAQGHATFGAEAGHEARARDLLARLRALRGRAEGGFAEEAGGALLSNPHMHLLEAALAWVEVGGGPEWPALADELMSLCATRFIDPATGWLFERFGEGWRPATGPDARLAEPGHQHEWAWLIDRHLRLRPDASGVGDRAALRDALFARGEAGLDHARGVPHMAVRVADDGRVAPTPGPARLWPSTERLKAALVVGEAEVAADAASALFDFFRTPIPGLWFDAMDENGAMIKGPAPTSSFYHVMCAFGELLCAVEQG